MPGRALRPTTTTEWRGASRAAMARPTTPAPTIATSVSATAFHRILSPGPFKETRPHVSPLPRAPGSGRARVRARSRPGTLQASAGADPPHPRHGSGAARAAQPRPRWARHGPFAPAHRGGGGPELRLAGGSTCATTTGPARPASAARACAAWKACRAPDRDPDQAHRRVVVARSRQIASPSSRRCGEPVARGRDGRRAGSRRRGSAAFGPPCAWVRRWRVSPAGCAGTRPGAHRARDAPRAARPGDLGQARSQPDVRGPAPEPRRRGALRAPFRQPARRHLPRGDGAADRRSRSPRHREPVARRRLPARRDAAPALLLRRAPRAPRGPSPCGTSRAVRAAGRRRVVAGGGLARLRRRAHGPCDVSWRRRAGHARLGGAPTAATPPGPRRSAIGWPSSTRRSEGSPRACSTWTTASPARCGVAATSPSWRSAGGRRDGGGRGWWLRAAASLPACCSTSRRRIVTATRATS